VTTCLHVDAVLASRDKAHAQVQLPIRKVRCFLENHVRAGQGRRRDPLRESKNASIVNISSAAGRVGFAMRTPYAAAKWGVIGLTKSLPIELGPDNIRVNAILPGLVAGDRQRRMFVRWSPTAVIGWEVPSSPAAGRPCSDAYRPPAPMPPNPSWWKISGVRGALRRPLTPSNKPIASSRWLPATSPS